MGGGGYLEHIFEKIISVENLLSSWKEFLNGKRKRNDVAEFGMNLMDNILQLHNDLKNFEYEHGGYSAFKINDPKPRDIHKATVRDRLLHHAIYRNLYPYFDKKFIFDSYSCRLNKGTYLAIDRLGHFERKVSRNYTKTIWILKCDIRKFFANIDHSILLQILEARIADKKVIWLIKEIIVSFHSADNQAKGLPLGNLTSHLFINIYMDSFDQYVKRKLKIKYYIRYADDFIILHQDKTHLVNLLEQIPIYLGKELKLSLNPNKVYIKTIASGVDFLGWVNFPKHRVLRTSTKKRMFRKIQVSNNQQTLQSYLGLISHGNSQKLRDKLFKQT